MYICYYIGIVISFFFFFLAEGRIRAFHVTAVQTCALPISRIATLPPDQAEVVLLRILGGLSVREVAVITGKRPGTVRVLQHRALRRLAREVRREAVTK